MKYYNPEISKISAIFLTVFLITTGCQQVVEEFAASDKYRLVWTNDPATKATLIWDQLQGNHAEVFFDTRDFGRMHWKYKQAQVSSFLNDKHEMNTYHVNLTGLQPDTKYFFVLKDSTGVSQRYWFKTAPGKHSAFTFIAGGDTKSEGDPLAAGRASNSLVAKLRPLFVLFNGDFTSGNGTNPDWWKTWLNDWHTQTTTADGRMIPVVPVHGNHENGDKANLVHIFNAPFQGNDSTNVYYSLSLGGDFFNITALNSEIEEGGDQRKWLQESLEKNQDHVFKVAAYHKPFWAHTTRKSEQPYQYLQWADLFHKYGLDMSFDADSHMSKITYPLTPDTTSSESMQGFVRDDKNGTMYVGEGSWGASPRSNDDDKPWTLTSGSFNQIKWIHVLPESDQGEASMKIYTVISSDRDAQGIQKFYYADVEPLDEENLFSVPANLNLQQIGEGMDFVPFPFHE